MREIALALFEILQPQGVAFVVDAGHPYMEMREVQKTRASTLTRCMLGCLQSNPLARQDFLSLISRK